MARVAPKGEVHAEAHPEVHLAEHLEGDLQMSLIQDLKSRYPKHHFNQDPESAIIGWVINDTYCTDPFLMDDGRFSCTADFHGLDTLDALQIVAHNLPLEMCQ